MTLEQFEKLREWIHAAGAATEARCSSDHGLSELNRMMRIEQEARELLVDQELAL